MEEDDKEIWSFGEDGLSLGSSDLEGQKTAVPASSVPDSVAFHKLDILRSKQIDRIMKINIIVSVLCSLYVIVAAILANTTYLRYATVEWKGNAPLRMRTVSDSFEFHIFELSVNVLVSIAMLVLAITFSVRILFNNKYPVTQEQIWVIVGLVTNALMLSPILQALLLLSKWNAAFKSHWLAIVAASMQTARYCASGAAIFFYLMATATTYGLLKPIRTRIEYLQFYLPKLCPLLPYMVLRVFAFHHGRIILSVIPFSNLVGMLANCTALNGTWFTKQGIYVCVITAFELYFLCYIALRIRATSRVLESADYIRFRSKQIGFRFFLFNNIMYYFLFFFFDVIQTVCIPRHILLKSLFVNGMHNYANASWGGFSYEYLNFWYQFFTAYVHLPPDAHGVRGWFVPIIRKDIENDQVITLSPISLSTAEPSVHTLSKLYGVDIQTKTTLVLDIRPHISSLCLPLHIGLFNFAWLAYDWGRNGMLPEDQFRWLDKRELVVHDHIVDKATDSNLIIVSAIDRIIVAFKGTFVAFLLSQIGIADSLRRTSVQNMKTDFQAVRTALSSVLPTYSSDHEMCETDRWKRARVHRGFLNVYSVLSERLVDCVANLVAVKPRPVLLTGHSLGGALATICSLDLRASLDLSDTDILVSTFGSPRIGNLAWSELYDEYVPIHWRFTVEQDIICTLPKFGYRHVGKRALMSNSGNLFLDPNSLEGILWTYELPDMIYHKKTAYMHCFAAFCNKYTELRPEFWGYRLGRAEEIAGELSRVTNKSSYRRNHKSDDVAPVTMNSYGPVSSLIRDYSVSPKVSGKSSQSLW